MYLNVGTFIETVGAFTGMPVRRGQFANLPLIAVAVGVHDGSIGTRAYMPMSVITAVKNVEASSSLGIPVAAAARTRWRWRERRSFTRLGMIRIGAPAP